MRKLIRSAGLIIAGMIGTRLKDAHSGEFLGRAIVIPWRGKIHIIGLKACVRPLFLPQKRLTYWRQEIGFTTHPQPDFPRITKEEPNGK